VPDNGGSRTFQVDLRGLVDLLSHHLYSSPRVYLRELLQNAVDAITARRALDPGAPASIRLSVERGGLRVEDCGIGLSEADVHTFLATIGRSSKRDVVAGVEVARREFLGQFGIGLLACFMVADEIEVVTRSATDPDAPPVQWRALADGSYTVRALPSQARAEPGTTVVLTPRPGAERWFDLERVVELARDFGALLPYEVTVGADGREVRTTETPPVWDRHHGSPRARWAALYAYGAQALGFSPLDVIELDVPLAGVRGVAYVLPAAASPAEKGRHRVYLKGMLLSDAVERLLPDWAFFARCVIDSDTLRPTASRETLYEDDTLEAVRQALGAQVREWLTGLAASDPDRLNRFLRVHMLGVKSLARYDDELFRIMLPWLPFETTDGVVNLAEFTRNHPVVHMAQTTDEFRQVAPIAAAQGLGVVNCGYTYDAELLARLPDVLPRAVVTDLAADVVIAHLDMVEPARELALAGFLTAARARLDPLDCDVVLREFQPVSMPALYLDSDEAERERARSQVAAEADGLWSEILSSMGTPTARARLVLNHLSPLLRRLASLPHPDLAGAAVEAMYGQALLMSHRPLRAADAALLNRAFGELLNWAAQGAPAQGTPAGGAPAGGGP
jgi:molecular chaperone HtpG